MQPAAGGPNGAPAGGGPRRPTLDEVPGAVRRGSGADEVRCPSDPAGLPTPGPLREVAALSGQARGPFAASGDAAGSTEPAGGGTPEGTPPDSPLGHQPLPPAAPPNGLGRAPPHPPPAAAPGPPPSALRVLPPPRPETPQCAEPGEGVGGPRGRPVRRLPSDQPIGRVESVTPSEMARRCSLQESSSQVSSGSRVSRSRRKDALCPHRLPRTLCQVCKVQQSGMQSPTGLREGISTPGHERRSGPLPTPTASLRGEVHPLGCAPSVVAASAAPSSAARSTLFVPPQVVIRNPKTRAMAYWAPSECVTFSELSGQLSAAAGDGSLKLLDKAQMVVQYQPDHLISAYPSATHTYIWTVGGASAAEGKKGKNGCCSVQ
eukprot:TRINITY_DN21531_c0_g1_i1.p1 TRINITY_DN21531_c0_g1~~TRINITY_DN21531_c0_g1_i1.p1  ORF type:complete len:442 (+),score=69.23 TRINITY_DN21531_c0_g1_i1:201-1328(+)